MDVPLPHIVSDILEKIKSVDPSHILPIIPTTSEYYPGRNLEDSANKTNHPLQDSDNLENENLLVFFILFRLIRFDFLGQVYQCIMYVIPGAPN